VEKKENIKMDRIDTEKIMMNEHGGLPRYNKTTCKTACMEFVEYNPSENRNIRFNEKFI
jgi:hypothetical protein